MIEVRTDWVNDIEYAWNDFALVIALQTGLIIGSLVFLYMAIRK